LSRQSAAEAIVAPANIIVANPAAAKFRIIVAFIFVLLPLVLSIARAL